MKFLDYVNFVVKGRGWATHEDHGHNLTYYLYNIVNTWGISPCDLLDGYSRVFTIDANGSVYRNHWLIGEGGVRFSRIML